jgi:uncharacterized protein (TIGR02118 family)
MIKLTFCLHRLDHLSREEFQDYWLKKHGPLVRRRQKALRLRRYVQIHTLDDPANELIRASRGAPEGYDGIAELWWDSIEDLNEALESEEGRKAGLELFEDEKMFIDHERSPLGIGREVEVIEDSIAT